MNTSLFTLPAVALATLLLVACGTTTSPTPEAGFTRCGGVTCQPGQYCLNETFDNCTDGCLSNINCAADQVCDTDAFNPTCINTSAPPPMMDAAVDGLGACQAACDHFQTCGLGAADTAGCRSQCASLTMDQQLAIGGCGDDLCISVTTCLGVDCLSDADCGAGQECLDFDCL